MKINLAPHFVKRAKYVMFKYAAGRESELIGCFSSLAACREWKQIHEHPKKAFFVPNAKITIWRYNSQPALCGYFKSY